MFLVFVPTPQCMLEHILESEICSPHVGVDLSCGPVVLLVMAGCSVFHILVVLGRNAFCYIMRLD